MITNDATANNHVTRISPDEFHAAVKSISDLKRFYEWSHESIVAHVFAFGLVYAAAVLAAIQSCTPIPSSLVVLVSSLAGAIGAMVVALEICRWCAAEREANKIKTTIEKYVSDIR